MRARLVAALLLAGCTQPVTTVLPQSIPVVIDNGVLTLSASTDDVETPFTVAVDTASVLTVYDDLELADMRPALRARIGDFSLWTDATGDGGVARATLSQIQLWNSPIGPVGIGAATVPVHGVFGGDNLSRFQVGLDLRAPPQISLLPLLTECSCDLADSGQAVFPFTLAGGQNTLMVGGDLYTYPATRVVIDACLEPLADPLQTGVPCVTTIAGSANGVVEVNAVRVTNAPYLPSGVDVKLVVGTGLPGLVLSAGAWDRLRKPGDAAKALATATSSLSLPDGSSTPASPQTLGGNGRARLAMVSRELYFAPCAELARSRRQRAVPPGTVQAATNAGCLRTRSNNVDPATIACGQQARPPEACDDTDLQNAPTAAVVELDNPATVLVIDDSSSLLQGINEDIRPTGASIDGVLGLDTLAELVGSIDYKGPRLVVRCAADNAGCVAYRRFIDISECGRQCTPVSSLVGPQNTVISHGQCPAAAPR
jgi:hypothetical protein